MLSRVTVNLHTPTILACTPRNSRERDRWMNDRSALSHNNTPRHNRNKTLERLQSNWLAAPPKSLLRVVRNLKHKLWCHVLRVPQGRLLRCLHCARWDSTKQSHENCSHHVTDRAHSRGAISVTSCGLSIGRWVSCPCSFPHWDGNRSLVMN